MIALPDTSIRDCGVTNPAAGWLRCVLVVEHEGSHVAGAVRWDSDRLPVATARLRTPIRVRDWWRASSPETAQAIVATLTLHGLRCDVMSRAGLTRVVIEHALSDRTQVARLIRVADSLASPVAGTLAAS